MVVAKTLAYYDRATITAIKSLILHSRRFKISASPSGLGEGTVLGLVLGGVALVFFCFTTIAWKRKKAADSPGDNLFSLQAENYRGQCYKSFYIRNLRIFEIS